jgi:hypothetical protein
MIRIWANGNELIFCAITPNRFRGKSLLQIIALTHEKQNIIGPASWKVEICRPLKNLSIFLRAALGRSGRASQRKRKSPLTCLGTGRFVARNRESFSQEQGEFFAGTGKFCV